MRKRDVKVLTTCCYVCRESKASLASKDNRDSEAHLAREDPLDLQARPDNLWVVFHVCVCVRVCSCVRLFVCSCVCVCTLQMHFSDGCNVNQRIFCISTEAVCLFLELLYLPQNALIKWQTMRLKTYVFYLLSEKVAQRPDYQWYHWLFLGTPRPSRISWWPRPCRQCCKYTIFDLHA